MIIYDAKLSFILEQDIVVEDKNIYLVYQTNKHLIGRIGDKIVDLRTNMESFIKC